MVQTRPLFCFNEWYVNNLRLGYFVKRNSLRCLNLGYEELSLGTETALELLCDFLGVQSTQWAVSLSASTSHSVLGNRMRFDSEKLKSIRYDNRWFSRNEWLISAILCPHVMIYNKKRVYSHKCDSFWRA
jgi:hypothetical protein